MITIVHEWHVWWCDAITLFVWNYFCAAISINSYTGMCCAYVNTNYYFLSCDLKLHGNECSCGLHKNTKRCLVHILWEVMYAVSYLSTSNALLNAYWWFIEIQFFLCFFLSKSCLNLWTVKLENKINLRYLCCQYSWLYDDGHLYFWNLLFAGYDGALKINYFIIDP